MTALCVLYQSWIHTLVSVTVGFGTSHKNISYPIQKYVLCIWHSSGTPNLLYAVDNKIESFLGIINSLTESNKCALLVGVLN